MWLGFVTVKVAWRVPAFSVRRAMVRPLEVSRAVAAFLVLTVQVTLIFLADVVFVTLQVTVAEGPVAPREPGAPVGPLAPAVPRGPVGRSPPAPVRVAATGLPVLPVLPVLSVIESVALLAPGDVGAKRTSTVQLSLCASV